MTTTTKDTNSSTAQEDTQRVRRGCPKMYLAGGAGFGIVLCCLIMYTTQLVVRQPLMARISVLEQENARLKTQVPSTEPKAPPTPPREPAEKKMAAKAPVAPMKRASGTTSRSLLVYIGDYSLAKLPGIKKMLYVLKARGGSATFVFNPTVRELRIMRQIRAYGHEIGFERAVPEWALANAPVLRSMTGEESHIPEHPYIDYQLRADAPGQSSRELAQFLESSRPGDIVLVDPLQNIQTTRALSRILRQPSWHVVSISQLLTTKGEGKPEKTAAPTTGRQLSLAGDSRQNL